MKNYTHGSHDIAVGGSRRKKLLSLQGTEWDSAIYISGDILAKSSNSRERRSVGRHTQ